MNLGNNISKVFNTWMQLEERGQFCQTNRFKITLFQFQSLHQVWRVTKDQIGRLILTRAEGEIRKNNSSFRFMYRLFNK